MTDPVKKETLTAITFIFYDGEVEGEDDPLSTGAIIGIVIGVLVLLVIVIVVVCRYKSKESKLFQIH